MRWHLLEIFCLLVFSTRFSVVLYIKTRGNKHSIYMAHLCTSPRGIIFGTSCRMKHDLCLFFFPGKSFSCPLCSLIWLNPKSSVVYLLNPLYEILLILYTSMFGTSNKLLCSCYVSNKRVDWIPLVSLIFPIILYHPYIHIPLVSLLRHVFDIMSQKWRIMNVLSFYHK